MKQREDIGALLLNLKILPQVTVADALRGIQYR